MEDAETHAMVGQCAEALRELPPGLALNRDSLTLERAARTYALCGAGDQVQKLSSELAERFPDATLTVRVSIPVAAAALALHRGQTARALDLLEPVRPYDHAPSGEFWPRYLRGGAYLRLKDGGAAGEQFRSILNHQGEVPSSMLYVMAHFGLARASALVDDVATARGAYESAFKLWKEADPDLQPLKEARLEYSRLR
jgi:hypothetical protein